jgi:pre-mRNA-splicing helicase BRR2
VLISENRTREHGPSGEPETLRGKKLPKMGDRVERAKAPIEERTTKKRKKPEEEKAKKKSKVQPPHAFSEPPSQSAGGVLSIAQDLGDPTMYRPKSRETKAAYEQLLTVIQTMMGAQPQEVLRGAAEEILYILKNDKLRVVPLIASR